MSGLEPPADADVQPFGVLAEHDEVDVCRARSFSGQSRSSSRRDRAVVDVEVELEARAEQDVARVPVVGDARIAERADEDRVEARAARVAVRRDRHAGLRGSESAPHGKLSNTRLAAKTLPAAGTTFTASAVTSTPIPSPGMTAIRIGGKR